MTNPERTAPKSRRIVLMMIAACAASLLYALFIFASNTGLLSGKSEGQSAAEKAIAPYAKGSMAALRVLPKAPAQPINSFIDAEGKSRTLADFKGRVAVVNLWATWCTPCLAELPAFAKLAGASDPTRLMVVAISIDNEAATDKAMARIASYGEPKFQFFQDKSAMLPFALEAPGVPTTVIYDAEGEEIARLEGAADWASPEAMALFQSLIK